MNLSKVTQSLFDFTMSAHTNQRSSCVSDDGVLNFEEYIQLMEQQKTVDEREDDIVQAFCVFDSESNGYIESADLRELLENMHWDISAEELKDLIISSNLQQDQKIDIEGRISSSVFCTFRFIVNRYICHFDKTQIEPLSRLSSSLLDCTNP